MDKKLEKINIEYTNVCAEIGHLGLQIELAQKRMKLLCDKRAEINLKATKENQCKKK